MDSVLNFSRQPEPYGWRQVSHDAPFAPRDGAGLLSFKGRLWLLGGWNPHDKKHFPRVCNAEVWSSPDGMEWRLETPDAPWEGRHTAGYAVHGGMMWIVGGDCIQGHYQPDIWCSENGKDWSIVHHNAPWGNRCLHHTVPFRGKIWVMGGQTMPGFIPDRPESIFYNDVWCSEDGTSWELATPCAGWEPRGMIGGFAVLHGRIWLLGGGTYDTPEFPVRRFHNDVWSSKDGINWECHAAHCPWQARQYHETAAFDGRLWVMEGYDGSGNRNDVWHSMDGISWQELHDTPWLPRHAAGVTVHGNSLYLVAGNNMASDVWRLDRKA